MSTNGISLRHIEVFHAIYVNGSVTAAASALNVSQPSVSGVLKHAEMRLGFALFRRVKSRLVPSEEAHILFKEVDELYRRMGSVHVTAKNLRGGGEGHIRLAMPPALGFIFVSTAVARFGTRYPQVTFDLQTRLYEETGQSLFERESDLALGYDAPQHPRLSSTPIGTGELAMLFRRRDLKLPASPVGLEVLSGVDVIGLSGGPLGNLLSTAIRASTPAFRTRVTVHTCHLAAALVRSGVGVAIVDEFTAKASVTPDLDFRYLSPAVYFGIHAIYLADRPPSGNIKRFLETLKKVIADK